MLTLSFEEIIPGSSVRFTDDGMLFAVDLVMAITGKNRDEAGMVIRRLTDEIFTSSKLIERNTGGRGNARTKLVTFNDALELIMVLPGKMAKETRTKFAEIIKRYLAGDSSLVKELVDNANSLHAVNVLARGPAEELAVENPRKRLLEELEIQEKTCDLQAKIMRHYQSLCPNGVIEDHMRLLFKDNFANLAMGDYGQKRITNDGEANPNKPITVSTVAAQMGITFSDDKAYQKIGRNLRDLYFSRYNRAPSKHEQKVGGAMREVNSYSERDRDLVEQAIREHTE